ncbi:MAG: hypothetical protein NTU94_04345, partial [Planctomycetota bacterium]|nr:hypothetical protein [Planctomycetota bacterium]
MRAVGKTAHRAISGSETASSPSAAADACCKGSTTKRELQLGPSQIELLTDGHRFLGLGAIRIGA